MKYGKCSYIAATVTVFAYLWKWGDAIESMFYRISIPCAAANGADRSALVDSVSLFSPVLQNLFPISSFVKNPVGRTLAIFAKKEA